MSSDRDLLLLIGTPLCEPCHDRGRMIFAEAVIRLSDGRRFPVCPACVAVAELARDAGAEPTL